MSIALEATTMKRQVIVSMKNLARVEKPFFLLIGIIRRVKIMNKEEFRKYIYGEPHEVPRITSEEAFKEGIKVGKGLLPSGMSGYDSAGRYLCRSVIAFSQRVPEKWKQVDEIYKDMNALMTKEKFENPQEAQAKAQEILQKHGFKLIEKKKTGNHNWIQNRTFIHPSWNLDTSISQLRQDIVMAALERFDELMDEELKADLDKMGPTGFMWSWAVNSAIYLLSD